LRKVHVISCGHETGDKGSLTLLKDVGKIVEIPYHVYLIEDSEYKILVDTGTSVRWRELHPEELVKSWPVYMKEEEYLDNRLASLGFDLEEVDYVVNTHLHYDHCGNNEMFPKATFLVNKNELAHALAPGWWEAPSYVRAVFDNPKLRYETIDGEFELTSGVRVVPSPGHSEGHQSVMVELARTGLLVLAGDAVYLRENLETPILPGLYVDARLYADSMRRLKHTVDLRKGTMLLSHSKEYLSPQGWKSISENVYTFE